MRTSDVQIIATIGPSSADANMIREMVDSGMDLARLNFGWGSIDEHTKHVACVRAAEKAAGRGIKIIFDLPGPRIQKKKGHTYDKNEKVLLTADDETYIGLGVKSGIDYFALSFVGDKEDIVQCRDLIKKYGGGQKIVAKIERQKALDNLEEILSAADALMIARGDLGAEVPLEAIPFLQDKIIKLAKKAGKPVITATHMLLSMTEHDAPTRAEVTDVAYAVLGGSDAVMLSDETASGAHPAEAVAMMEKIIIEAEKHMGTINNIHRL